LNQRTVRNDVRLITSHKIQPGRSYFEMAVIFHSKNGRYALRVSRQWVRGWVKTSDVYRPECRILNAKAICAYWPRDLVAV
jgi:hypothetical protein